MSTTALINASRASLSDDDSDLSTAVTHHHYSISTAEAITRINRVDKKWGCLGNNHTNTTTTTTLNMLVESDVIAKMLEGIRHQYDKGIRAVTCHC